MAILAVTCLNSVKNLGGEESGGIQLFKPQQVGMKVSNWEQREQKLQCEVTVVAAAAESNHLLLP